MVTEMSSERGRVVTVIILTAGLLGVAVLAMSVAARSRASARVATGGARAAGLPAAAVLSGLEPLPVPERWKSATIRSGAATLSYPSNWRPIPGDSGTVTAALRDGAGRYAGYLNVTPRQGREQLARWAAFRTRRNAEDGDGQVHELAAAEGIGFTDARGSCVVDQYLSRAGAHLYRELACIVAGRTHTSVFVGAALVSDWRSLGFVVVRAAESLRER
jgi:hypothetical protein